MRRELGHKAKDILLCYTNELPRLIKPMLVTVKTMLTQKGIIDSESIDLSTLGVSSQLTASELYETVITSLESNPSKFPDLISVFKGFNTFTSVAEELEKAGTEYIST